ncbi:MAG: hypothetical protein ACUVUG_07650 [Candidatus Aminicenantia bacterium]
MKLAFVIYRFGANEISPLEIYCRITAENLYRNGFDVSIYTTASEKHKEGEYILNGVLIKRFPDGKKGGKFSYKLIKKLSEEGKNYDAIVFFDFKNPLTIFGSKEIKGKKILVPFLYGEGGDRSFESLSNFDGFVFMTERESEKAEPKLKSKKRAVIEFGIKEKREVDSVRFKKRFLMISDYLFCYLDDEKMLGEVIENFKLLKRGFPFLSLIISGKLSCKIPFDPDIKYFEPESEKDRWECIKGALFSIFPSCEDTPEFLLLESMSLSVPLVVNGRANTLVDYCVKGNCGLWYSTKEEFYELGKLLINNNSLREKMGINALKYIRERHSLKLNFLRWKDFLVSIF